MFYLGVFVGVLQAAGFAVFGFAIAKLFKANEDPIPGVQKKPSTFSLPSMKAFARREKHKPRIMTDEKAWEIEQREKKK